MSLFDKDLVTRETPVQKFYNLWETAVKGEFNDLYKKFEGDLSRVSSVYNSALNRSRQKFAEYGMYYPWLLCDIIADVKSIKIKNFSNYIIYRRSFYICT